MKEAPSTVFTPDSGEPSASCNRAVVIMEKVNQWYGRMQVLRDVSLCVEEGSCVVLCGPSGSGKSSALRCISRLETHQTGRIVVDGVELTDDPACISHIQRDVAMIFQSVNLFPHMSVLENCTLAPIWSRGMRREEAEASAAEALRQVGLLDRAHQHPAGLNAGELQRVAIARALCMSPRIMLFDEPTVALPPEMKGPVLEVMESVAESDITMICVANELEYARKAADRIIFMDQGNILADDAPSVFFERTSPPELRAFLATV
ncbi:General L-amino acid transport ATP-binding protein aapP [Granulibacter bethesdensis]|uniref:General L-amino acid transport ATP-binding protein aapP n=1 Tax=Granulibacter bethesdensis TaxID=364410 RepID=A0AAC9P7B3_9PROT|nr:amino acid ABC transporter ATP-binding protein [Granulibacter bethesdensis]APH53241.1 General L-amino acid transport ATP-binding protein aapP [Granulibacter bethesdensis]APH60817.1 General L-amino acid transport ATP-binding protein aapP [Granulibacter bethesdensis]